ncbi:MAG TPA: MFS transporter [Enorma massiliensis]|uniref:MFS transporter n=2 Tax=Enorma massiliensis TaxID=1472761 RepID=UPI001D68370A|nr:MFS transporter [Enorma massiliensis]HJG62250.1 MFS transporter [Enorma massiliensis]
MPAGLLPIIYLAFISLGLPDSAIGSAWPTMAPSLGAGISWVGVVTMIISAGTIVSSLMSVRVVERFGTGRVTVASVALTAAALVGFSQSQAFWQLCLWAVPYGLGAGAVDAALNAFVAVHYESQHMSWLHCMWGVGASGGPMVMAQCLERSTWSTGFLVLGGIQVGIALVLTLSLPLWRDRKLPRVSGRRAGREAAIGAAPEAALPRGEAAHGAGARALPGATAAAGAGEVPGAAAASGAGGTSDGTRGKLPARRTRAQLLRIPGVKAVLVSFFCYSAFEATCGNWAATFCTLARGIDAQTAASWAALFYMGITAGRAVSGFISLKVNDRNMIRLGQALIAVAFVCVLMPGDTALIAGLVLMGCGCAPIYPSTIHATPARFGEELALELTGMQMAFAYIGSLAMSPLFGVLAQFVGAWIYPWYLVLFLVGMVVTGERLNGVVRLRERARA